MSYYDRGVIAHLDGTPIFATPEDEAKQRAVADLIERAWACSLHSFGRLAPIDWWAERDGRIVAVLELQARSQAHDQYPTVFLNVRKWLALELAQSGLGVPAIFVVSFTDEPRWISITDVDPRQMDIGGTRTIVKSRNDIEPVIHVSLDAMRVLA